MWIRTIALALLISAPLASNADPRLWSPDASLESSTTTLTAPLVEGGLLLAKSCDACKSHPLRLTSQTLLFIGNRQVTVAELNQFLKGGAVYNLGIFYDRTAQTITKLVVFANPAPRPAANRG
jgi:hypothetical protein